MSLNVKSVKTPFRPAALQPLQANGRGQGQGAWRDVPVVNQLNPQGASPNTYRNGAYNCAGAVAATLARMLGTHADKTDADLINDLSRGRTTAQGTTVADLTEMIKDVGARIDKKPLVGAYKDKTLDSLLAKGNKVIAQVGLRNNSTGKHDPHYVIINGKDANGNYLIKDPLKGEYTATPKQLREAVYKTPGYGGVLIPVAPGRSQPGAQGGGARPWMGLQVQGGMGIRPPTSSKPFETDNSHVRGVDTSFKPYFTDTFEDYHARKPDDTQAENARFSRSVMGEAPPATTDAPQHVSPDTTPESFADRVLKLLRNLDPSTKEKGFKLLDLIDDSANAVDRRAFELILQRFGGQPGIGQRVGYNGYGG